MSRKLKRSLTEETFRVPGRGGTDAIVTVARWRNSDHTAFIEVRASGPEGVKSWRAKSQGPSSGGFNKAVQAASRVHHEITGRWGSEGSENLATIVEAAAAYVGCRPSGTGLYSNPRRRRSKMKRIRGRRRTGRRNPADEQRELEIFIVNNYDLYKGQHAAIVKNLAKKIRKGVYDHAKAAKLWTYLADSGAQKYHKAHGSGYGSSYGIFTKADRIAVGKSLADVYLDEVKEAASTKSNPRYRRTKMARRKKTRRSSKSKGYRGGVRVVRFKVRGRTKIVRFHKPGTKAGKRGSAAKRAAGKRLARKYGFFRKGAAIYQRRPGKKAKLIRRL